jgi:hypothetical protein
MHGGRAVYADGKSVRARQHPTATIALPVSGGAHGEGITGREGSRKFEHRAKPHVSCTFGAGNR